MLSLLPGLVLGLLSTVEMVLAGCRWYNPTWLPSLDSAPQVDITKGRLVTVFWNREQFQDKFDCADKFEVGVENSEVEGERRLCSVNREAGVDSFNCKLDLSSTAYCGQRFGFWVTAVNLNHNRGVERIRSFANSVIDIKCKGLSLTKKVKSSSCLAVSPEWQSQPYIIQTKEDQLEIAWDSRQLTNSHCVDHFLLKFWESSSFSPKYTKLKFILTEDQTLFGGKMDVIACKSYTYILSAVRGGGTVRDTQGDFTIPCPGEPFLDPAGEKYVVGSRTTEEAGNANPKDSEREERNEASQAHDLSGTLDSAIASNDIDPEFSIMQRNVIEVQSKMNNEKVKPPHLVALNSTDESLTWQLEGLDPKIRIDKYQVACWDDMNDNVLVDLPCCKVEETPELEGDSEATLIVSSLQPNTTYSCQGGMLVQGQWMFSPKALKITQGKNHGARNNLLSRLGFVILLLISLTSTSLNYEF